MKVTRPEACLRIMNNWFFISMFVQVIWCNTFKLNLAVSISYFRYGFNCKWFPLVSERTNRGKD